MGRVGTSSKLLLGLVVFVSLIFIFNPVFAETDLIDTSSSEPTGFKITEYGMFDSENYENSVQVHQLYVGKKYWFAFGYQNESEISQDAEVLVKLIDKNKTEDNVLKKIEGFTTLESSKGLEDGFSWTPEYIGEFKITAKVISPNDSLVGAIAPQYDLVVIERQLLKQQLKEGHSFDELYCTQNQFLVLKQSDDSPVCVTYHTGDKLLERGWATCDDEISYGRGHPCGVRSSPGISSDNT